MIGSTAHASMKCLDVGCKPLVAAFGGQVIFPNTSSASLNDDARCKTVFWSQSECDVIS